ncbi:MAG: hypothetical protein KDD60_10995, partial [Bdellovibrionales bacterium]|nr:hypothetical protein [Bdellovibrionales bacterium]
TDRQKQSKAISFWQFRPDNLIGGQYTVLSWHNFFIGAPGGLKSDWLMIIAITYLVRMPLWQHKSGT